LILTVTQTPTANQRFGVYQLTINKTTCNGTFYKVKPLFYIPSDQLGSFSDPLPMGNYPEGMTIYSYLRGGQIGVPASLGNPPSTGSLTATKSVVLAPNNTSVLPLLLDN
jgi:hypothetical protein